MSDRAHRAPPRPAVRALGLVLLALATLAAFGGVLRNGWILFDDPEYVTGQARVLGGLRFDHAMWFLAHAHAANWHPLTSWSHMLDVQLFGLRPGAHHAVSLFLHVVTALMLVLVLFRLTGAWWRALAVGGLFALHPLRVESVAWVAERKDVLSGLFFVLALEAYRRWAERPGAGRYALLLVVTVLGLMAKPMLMTLPLVLVLLDVWPLGRLVPRGGGGLGAARRGRAPGRSLAGLVIEKWPLWVLAAGSAIVTFLVQRSGGAVIRADAITPARRLANAALSYGRYVRDTLWPRDLAVFHPYRAGTDLVAVALCAAGLLAVTAACLWQARRRPYLAVGWLWYVGMLVPVIGLVQVGTQAYAERYTYLPTIGLLVALVWLVADLVARWRWARIAAAIALVAALSALSVVTWRQVAWWHDTKTLFTRTLAVTPPNPVARQVLGFALLVEGRPAEAVAQLDEAVRLSPDFAEAHSNLGSALGMLGRDAEAVAHFRAALAVRDEAEVHHNLGFTLARLGRTDEAIAEFEAALRRDPGRDLTRRMLEVARAARAGGATSAPLPGGAPDRDGIEAHRRTAAALAARGRVLDAIREYREVLRRDPDDLDALNNVAWIRATCAEAAYRDGAEAVRLAERARDRSPEPQAVLYSTLAAAYAEAGRFPAAVRAGERAVELARAGGDAGAVARFADQLRRYRAGRPFHFDR